MLAHGSRTADARAAFARLARTVCAAPALRGLPAPLFQFGMEGLPAALDTLAARGETDIAVLPFFLFSGFHLRQTVPALLARWQAAHPDVRVTLLPPFGQDAQVAALLAGQAARAARSKHEEP